MSDLQEKARKIRLKLNKYLRDSSLSSNNAIENNRTNNGLNSCSKSITNSDNNVASSSCENSQIDDSGEFVEEDFYDVPALPDRKTTKMKAEPEPITPGVQKKKCKKKQQKCVRKTPSNELRVPHIYKYNVNQYVAPPESKADKLAMLVGKKIRSRPKKNCSLERLHTIGIGERERLRSPTNAVSKLERAFAKPRNYEEFCGVVPCSTDGTKQCHMCTELFDPKSIDPSEYLQDSENANKMYHDLYKSCLNRLKETATWLNNKNGINKETSEDESAKAMRVEKTDECEYANDVRKITRIANKSVVNEDNKNKTVANDKTNAINKTATNTNNKIVNSNVKTEGNSVKTSVVKTEGDSDKTSVVKTEGNSDKTSVVKTQGNSDKTNNVRKAVDSVSTNVKNKKDSNGENKNVVKTSNVISKPVDIVNKKNKVVGCSEKANVADKTGNTVSANNKNKSNASVKTKTVNKTNPEIEEIKKIMYASGPIEEVCEKIASVHTSNKRTMNIIKDKTCEVIHNVDNVLKTEDGDEIEKIVRYSYTIETVEYNSRPNRRNVRNKKKKRKNINSVVEDTVEIVNYEEPPVNREQEVVVDQEEVEDCIVAKDEAKDDLVHKLPLYDEYNKIIAMTPIFECEDDSKAKKLELKQLNTAISKAKSENTDLDDQSEDADSTNKPAKLSEFKIEVKISKDKDIVYRKIGRYNKKTFEVSFSVLNKEKDGNNYECDVRCLNGNHDDEDLEDFLKTKLLDSILNHEGHIINAIEDLDVSSALIEYHSDKESKELVSETKKESSEICDENKNVLDVADNCDLEDNISGISDQVAYDGSDNDTLTSLSQHLEWEDDFDDIGSVNCDESKENVEILNIFDSDKHTDNVVADINDRLVSDEEDLANIIHVKDVIRTLDVRKKTLVKDDYANWSRLCEKYKTVTDLDQPIEVKSHGLVFVKDDTISKKVKDIRQYVKVEDYDDLFHFNDLESGDAIVDRMIKDVENSHLKKQVNLNNIKEMKVEERNRMIYTSFLTEYRFDNQHVIFINNRLPDDNPDIIPVRFGGEAICENLIMQSPVLLKNIQHCNIEYDYVYPFHEFPICYAVTLGRYLYRNLPVDIDEVVVVAFAEMFISTEHSKPVLPGNAVEEFANAIHGLMSDDGRRLGMPGAKEYEEFVKNELLVNENVAIKNPFTSEYYDDFEALYSYLMFVVSTKQYCQYSLVDVHFLCYTLIEREGYIPDNLMLHLIEDLDCIGYSIQITNRQIGLYYRRYGHSTEVFNLLKALSYMDNNHNVHYKYMMNILKKMPNSSLTCFITVGKALKFFEDFPWERVMLMCKKEWHNYTIAAIYLNGVKDIKNPCIFTSNYNNYPHLVYVAKEILINVGKEKILEYYPAWVDLDLKHKNELDSIIRQYIRFKFDGVDMDIKVRPLTPREDRERKFLSHLLHGFVYGHVLDPLDFDTDHIHFNFNNNSLTEKHEKEVLKLCRSRTVLRLKYFSSPHVTDIDVGCIEAVDVNKCE